VAWVMYGFVGVVGDAMGTPLFCFSTAMCVFLVLIQ